MSLRASAKGFDEARFLRLIRGQTRGPVASLARSGLWAASVVYGLGSRARNLGYGLGLLEVKPAPVPVISVGNLTLGGTGKTPFVEWICRWLRAREIRAAVLSRGYGASDGANDEALVLEENLPDVPHLQDKDRVGLAKIAVEELESQVLVLDDGFQHRRLGRDLDIVLVDALDPFGGGCLFPRGLLRESPRSFSRASWVVLTRADMVDESTRRDLEGRIMRLAGKNKPGWSETRHAPVALLNANGETAPLGCLEGKRGAAFCGIGNPEGFRRTFEPIMGPAAGFRVFPDHHSYTADDVRSLVEWTRLIDAELALTTQKDLVKLRTEKLGEMPLWSMRIGIEFLTGQAELEAALDRCSTIARSSRTFSH